MAEINTQGKPKNRWWQWVILGGLGLGIIFLPFPAKASMGTERTFRVDARQFEYEPAILAVNQGDRVTIELVVGDVVHGLSIDGYVLETTADPGQPASISFVADKAGTYRFHCTTTCGNLHPFMTGKLEVGQNSTLWRAMALSGLILGAGVWKRRL